MTGGRALLGVALGIGVIPAPALLVALIVGALSDWLDGWLARRMRAVTAAGATFDLVADGLFFLGALAALERAELIAFVHVVIVLVCALPQIIAQGIRLVGALGVGSTGHPFAKALGGMSYLVVVACAAGAPAVPLIAVLVATQLVANGRDLASTIAAVRRPRQQPQPAVSNRANRSGDLQQGRFSLYRGDPLWRALNWLSPHAGDPPHLALAMVTVSVVTWGVLACLAVLQAIVLPGDPLRARFFTDFSAAAQMVVALPLFLLAEVHLDWRARAGVRYVRTALVRRSDQKAFVGVLRQVGRLRTGPVEWLPWCCGAVLTVVWILDERARMAHGWYLHDSKDLWGISLPGWYGVLVVFPFLNGFWVRWVWKFGLWCFFLWKISRLELELDPEHPDGMAGLGIINWIQMAFALVVFATGVIMSATVAYKLTMQGMTSAAFGVWLPIGAFALLVPILFMGPLLFFTGKLLEAKQRGLVRLGILGSTYAREFGRYARAGTASQAAFIDLGFEIGGSASLASAYEHVTHMRIVPFDLQSLMRFTASAVTPLLPLLLRYTHIPADIASIINQFLGGPGGGGGH
jgi:phosphatidylglycerophosphate synthase